MGIPDYCNGTCQCGGECAYEPTTDHDQCMCIDCGLRENANIAKLYAENKKLRAALEPLVHEFDKVARLRHARGSRRQIELWKAGIEALKETE